MPEDTHQPRPDSRADVIRAVTSPLTLFALTVTVIEGILTAALRVSNLSQNQQFAIICAMVGLVLVLMLMVGFIAYNKPGHLSPEMMRAVHEAVESSGRVEDFIKSPAFTEIIYEAVDNRLRHVSTQHGSETTA